MLMDQNLLFSENENQDLQAKMIQIEKELNANPRAKAELLQNPSIFLSRFRIKVQNYIKRSRDLLNRFNNSVRNLFTHLADMANKCLACKVAVLLIFYAILGKAGGAWHLTVGVCNVILEQVNKFFKDTGKSANQFCEWLSKLADNVQPHELALKICRMHNLCGITNLSTLPVGAPTLPGNMPTQA